jgi:four helix bundle protein
MIVTTEQGKPQATKTGAKAKHYRELKIWQKGRLLVKLVYQLSATFPREERFGLVQQMREAAVSVPSNIAEGQARQHTREFLQFLSHVSGSLAELDTQMTLSQDLNFCTQQQCVEIEGFIGELQRMISSLRSKLAMRSSSH